MHLRFTWVSMTSTSKAAVGAGWSLENPTSIFGESLELSMWDWPKLMHIRNVILSKKGQLFWISIAPWAKAQCPGRPPQELQCQPTTPSGWSTRSSCIQCLWLKTHTRWTAPLMRFGIVFDHQAPLVIVTIHEGKNNRWNWVCHSEASHRGVHGASTGIH